MTAPAPIKLMLSAHGGDVEIGDLVLWPSGGADFTYVPGWLDRPGAFALAPRLPLQRSRQRLDSAKGALPTVFSDSAPDRWGRNLILRDFRVRGLGAPSETDYLLGVSDHTRLGAVRYLVDGTPQAAESRVPKMMSLSHLEDLARQVESNVADDTEIAEIADAGSSLGGARPKATVVDDDGHLMLAKFTSTKDQSEVIAWEKVCLDIAEKAGIQVPGNKLLRIAGRPVLVLDRFDREYDTDQVEHRVPYLSAMALLDLPDGTGSSMTRLADDFLPFSGPDYANQLQEMWMRAGLNLLVGNTDNHLRNHGFLHRDGQWVLSPVFDVTPATDKTDFATTIDDAGDDSIDTLLDVCDLFEFDRDEALDRLSCLVDAAADWRRLARQHRIPASEDCLVETGFDGAAYDRARELTRGRSAHPAVASAHAAVAGRCRRCGRPLKSPKSIARGFGPGCATAGSATGIGGT